MRRGAPPGGRALMYLSALAGAVAMVGMWNFLTPRQTQAPSVRHVVAVGNFETPEETDIGPGLELQANLLQQLSRYPDLLVREQAGEEATVQGKTDFLLDGNLRRRHPGWELAVRLRDVDEDRVLWSDAFPVARQDLEAAGERVVRGLARTLKVHPR